MTYEGLILAEAGSHENLAGHEMREPRIGVCCPLGFVDWLWYERVALKRSDKGETHSS